MTDVSAYGGSRALPRGPCFARPWCRLCAAHAPLGSAIARWTWAGPTDAEGVWLGTVCILRLRTPASTGCGVPFKCKVQPYQQLPLLCEPARVDACLSVARAFHKPPHCPSDGFTRAKGLPPQVPVFFSLLRFIYRSGLWLIPMKAEQMGCCSFIITCHVLKASVLGVKRAVLSPPPRVRQQFKEIVVKGKGTACTSGFSFQSHIEMIAVEIFDILNGLFHVLSGS